MTIESTSAEVAVKPSTTSHSICIGTRWRSDHLYAAASNDLVLRAAVESRIPSQTLVCSSEVLNDTLVEAQTEARTMPMVATSCGLLLEVDRGGIEPPTPGFSVGLSSAPDSHLTSDKLSGCDSSSNGEGTGAQQNAQHEPSEMAIDPLLKRLIEVWPTITEDVRLRVLELILGANQSR